MKKPLLLLSFLACGAVYAQNVNDNVIVGGTTAQLVLSADHPFHAPEAFTATAVTVQRNVKAGTGTFCLPFAVDASEIDATAEMGTYLYVNNAANQVMFEKQTSVGANTPFLMKGMATSKTELNFSNKEVAVTPATLGEVFVGNYDGIISGEGKWGIANATTFMQGGAGSTIKSFQAYLTNIGGPSSARELVFIDDATGMGTGTSTGTVNGVEAVYDLQGRRVANSSTLPKGIYIVNGKKVMVK